MISEEEEKAFQELGKKIDRLASIREHIDQAELEALNREYIKTLHLRQRARLEEQKRKAGE